MRKVTYDKLGVDPMNAKQRKEVKIKSAPIRLVINEAKSPLNWLLICFPLALLAEHSFKLPAPAIFTLAAIGIIPLAAMIVKATEQLAIIAGPAVGGLLNATFGNAPELIIALTALRAGEIELVKASIIGVILANLLFVLGLSLLLGGIRFRVQEYNPLGARSQGVMLLLTSVGILVPSLFHSFPTPATIEIEQKLNVAVAVVLLVVYVLSLLFMLKTHPEYFTPVKAEHHEQQKWNSRLALMILVISSVLLAILSEVLVGSVEETAEAIGLSKIFIGVVVLALIGGSAESIAAVVMALKNQVDLTIGIAVGSTLQIGLFVFPVLILLSHVIAPHPMDFVFGPTGVTIVFISVLIAALISSDGRSTWFKGVQLLSIYILIALFCYFLPDGVAAPAAAIN